MSFRDTLWRPFDAPWVIAHRGASGCLPEHVLPGYALAIEQGCDVIEPDLVSSADGFLFARHDLGLRRSTDIARRAEFAARERMGVDGSCDWWIDDFSAADLGSLRAIEPWKTRSARRDGLYCIPRFAAILDLLLLERRRRERPILVYPELKEPEYFARLGIDLVELLHAELEPRGLLGPRAPVLVQCFDAPTLQRVAQRSGLRVVLLSATLPDLNGPSVDGYGVNKSALMDSTAGAEFIAAAHARGRMVHAWTFRDDQSVAGLDPQSECEAAFSLGCDGVFSDFPATARRAREQFLARLA